MEEFRRDDNDVDDDDAGGEEKKYDPAGEDDHLTVKDLSPPLLRLPLPSSILTTTFIPRLLPRHVVNRDFSCWTLENKIDSSSRIRRRRRRPPRQQQPRRNEGTYCGEDGEDRGRRIRRCDCGPPWTSPSWLIVILFFLAVTNKPCQGFFPCIVSIVPSSVRQHHAARQPRRGRGVSPSTIHRTMRRGRQQGQHQRLLSNVNNNNNDDDDEDADDDTDPLSPSLLNDGNMEAVSGDDEDDEDHEYVEEKELTGTIVNDKVQLRSDLYSSGAGGVRVGADAGSDRAGTKNQQRRRHQQPPPSSSPPPSASKMFSKIRNNPVLAEALLMDLLQRQQQEWEQREQQSDSILEEDSPATNITNTTTATEEKTKTTTTTTTVQLERISAEHFNVVMDMYIHDRTRTDGPEQALRVFYTLLDLYYEYRDNNPSSLRVYENREDVGTDLNASTATDDDDQQLGLDKEEDSMNPFCPNFWSYETLVYGFKNQGNPEKAKEVVQLMIKDSIGYYDDHPLSNETLVESQWENRGTTAMDIMTRHNKTSTAFFNKMYNPHNGIPFPVKSFYNAVLRAYADQSSPLFDLNDPDSPANRADGFLLWLEDQHDKYRPYMPFRSKLNSYSYSLVMQAWVAQACEFYDDGTIVTSDGREKGDRGGDHSRTGQNHRPMFRSPSLGKGNSNRGRTGYRDFEGQHIQVEALIRALQLLKRMKAMYERDGRRESLAGIPSVHAYYSLLRPFCRMGQGRRAEQLLDLCIKTRIRVQELRDEKKALSLSAAKNTEDDDDDSEDVDYDVDQAAWVTNINEVPLRVAEPTTKMFFMVMDAWSHSYDDAEAAERVENLLRRMIEYHDSGQLPFVEAPNTAIYNTVIHAWSRSKNIEAPYRALEILKTMKARSQESGENIRPDVITYSGVMNAFGRRGLVRETVEVFEMMFHDFSVEGNKDAQPDDVAISTLINAMVRKQDQLLLKKKKARGRLNKEDIAEEEWCSPERAERILKRMEDMYRQGVLQQRPSQSYGDLSTLYARSDRRDGPSQAREILANMQMWYETGENPAAKPNAIQYNRVLDGFARAGDLWNTKLVLNDMIRLAETGKNTLVRPDAISYTTVINAHKWVKGEKIDPERAERFFRIMEERSQSEDGKNNRSFRPDCIGYTSLIDCYAKAAMGCHDDDVDEIRRYLRRNEELLDEMIALSKAGVRKVVPVELTFNTVLKGFAFSKGLDQKEDRIEDRVNRILDLMNEHNVRPNKYTDDFVRCAMGNNGSGDVAGAANGTRRTTTSCRRRRTSSRSNSTRPSWSNRSPSFRTTAPAAAKDKRPGTTRTRYRK